VKSRKTVLGEIRPVTGSDGEPFVAILSRKSLGISPEQAREAGRALLDAADEASRVTVQDSLWSEAS
jgi:hypothetical protein